MSIKRLSGAGLTTPKSNKLWDQTTFQSGMFALATISLTSAQASVSFSGISSSYTHLQLRVISRTDDGGPGQSAVYLQFNSDTSTNYSWHRLYGNGSSASAGASSTSTTWALSGIGAYAANPASEFGASVIDILDYTSTVKAKTIKGLSGEDENGAGYVGLHSGLWFKNSASVYESVSSIQIKPGSGNFVANSQFALYGIKTA
jgi:hypothetical protein